jgi:hypothetical protein
MCLKPEYARGGGWIDTGLVPPSGFIARAVSFAVMASTKRHGELIADFAAKRS